MCASAMVLALVRSGMLGHAMMVCDVAARLQGVLTQTPWKHVNVVFSCTRARPMGLGARTRGHPTKKALWTF